MLTKGQQHKYEVLAETMNTRDRFTNQSLAKAAGADSTGVYRITKHLVMNGFIEELPKRKLKNTTRKVKVYRKLKQVPPHVIAEMQTRHNNGERVNGDRTRKGNGSALKMSAKDTLKVEMANAILALERTATSMRNLLARV